MKDNWFNRTFRPYALADYKNDMELKAIDKRLNELYKNGATPNMPKYTLRFVGKFMTRRYIK